MSYTKEFEEWTRELIGNEIDDSQIPPSLDMTFQEVRQNQAHFWLSAFVRLVKQNADKSFSFRVDKTFRTTTEYGYALVDSYNECKKKLLGE